MPSTGRPARAGPGPQWWRRLTAAAVGWPGVAAVAVLTSVPATCLILAVAERPLTPTAWLALTGPLLLALAVVVAPRSPDLGAFTAALALATGIQAGVVLLGSLTGPWPTFILLTLYLGVGWVAWALGTSSTRARGIGWMAVLALLTAWRLGDEAWPIVLAMLGWFAVGWVARSRREVAASLEARAAELAAEQERYAQEAIRLERATIARELHDVVAHNMTVIVIQAQAGRQLVADDRAAAADALDSISASATEAEADIVALVELVAPGAARPLTRQLLDDLVHRAAATGTRVTLHITGDPACLDLAVARAAHRAVQEALTNAFRHAPGAGVDLWLDCRAGLRLEVVSEPARFPAPLASTGTGQGLRGLRERLVEVGGSVGWGTREDGSWSLMVTAPRLGNG